MCGVRATDHCESATPLLTGLPELRHPRNRVRFSRRNRQSRRPRITPETDADPTRKRRPDDRFVPAKVQEMRRHSPCEHRVSGASHSPSRIVAILMSRGHNGGGTAGDVTSTNTSRRRLKGARLEATSHTEPEDQSNGPGANRCVRATYGILRAKARGGEIGRRSRIGVRSGANEGGPHNAALYRRGPPTSRIHGNFETAGAYSPGLVALPDMGVEWQPRITCWGGHATKRWPRPGDEPGRRGFIRTSGRPVPAPDLLPSAPSGQRGGETVCPGSVGHPGGMERDR